MRYSDVIAQEPIKERLRSQLREGRVPHASLFAGPGGAGKLPTAWAYASALLCQRPVEGEACGECPACRMTAEGAHPDLHFVFPVLKSKEVSDTYIKEWRAQLKESPYFDRTDWLKRIGVANQQSLIPVAESDVILQKLSLVSQQGGYKVMIIWQPEQMNVATANKLLKILEEPPRRTVFLLVSDRPDALLETIRSRTQRIDFPQLSEAEIAQALMTHNALGEADAKEVAHLAGGSFTKACQLIRVNEDEETFFDLFVQIMRNSYARDIRSMYAWSEQVSTWGRERQKNFLQFVQRMVRENFIYNFQRPELTFMSAREAQFSQRFARFVNERNVFGLMEEFALAQRDIEQNVNPRMVFFDLTLKITVLLKA